MTPLDVSWMDGAACATRPDLGWISEPEDVGLGEEATMSVTCARCPVHTDCAAYVEKVGISAGFWAGHHQTADGPLLSFAGGDAA